MNSRSDESRAALLRDEQFQQTVFNAIPEQIVVIDAAGEILHTNAAWDKSADTPSAAIPYSSRNYLANCSGPSLREVRDGVARVLAGHSSIYETEYRRGRGEESDRWFTLIATPLDGGGAVLVHEDVTARKVLEREILELSEYERRQMGRELHDGLCQVLGGMVLSIAVLATASRKRNDPNAEEMSRLVEVARSATEQVRELSRSLHPVQLDGHGLAAALQELCGRINERVECRLECPGEVTISDSNKALSLYRIAQEATANALRHSGAERIVVHLREKNRRISLSIEDNGSGYRIEGNTTAGMGVRIMRYRANAIGASFRIKNLNGHGTRVHCSLPTPG